MSTATSKIDPLVTRKSLAWANGGIWKWSPRTTPLLADKEWLSCTKGMSIPCSRSALSLKTSEKNPRASTCLTGLMTFTSAISVSTICIEIVPGDLYDVLNSPCRVISYAYYQAVRDDIGMSAILMVSATVTPDRSQTPLGRGFCHKPAGPTRTGSLVVR